MFTKELFDKIMSVETSNKMLAVLGYAFDFAFTSPVITEIYIINDTIIYANSNNPAHHNILSNFQSLEENWKLFWEILNDELTTEEKEYVDKVFKKKFKQGKGITKHGT